MNSDQHRGAVVTGMAVETCIGRSLDEFWNNLSQGLPGTRPIELFDPGDLPCQVAGQVLDFDPTDILDSTEIRRTTRTHQLLLSVVKQVFESVRPPGRTGLIVGSGGSGTVALSDMFETDIERITNKGWKGLERLTLLKVLPPMATSFVAQKFGMTGPALTVNTACASSTDAVGVALHMIRGGAIDSAIVAGVDTYISKFVLGAFCKLNALTTVSPEDASTACKPFDLGRDGMVPSEGAAAICIQRMGAFREKDTALASIVGAASSNDAYHPLMPRPDGDVAAKTILCAIADAGFSPNLVNYVNAHGTATSLNDVAETRAIKLAFGDRAKEIPVSSFKGTLGHASGASGIIELVGMILALNHEFIPPTANLNDSDPECDLDYVPLVGRSQPITRAVKCSFGFGGHNSVLIVTPPMLGPFDIRS